MFFGMNLQRHLRKTVVLVVGLSLSFGSVAAFADDTFSQKLIGRAMDLIGVKYRFGGTSPATGLDCSGYVQYVFKNAVGVSLPRVAAAQSRVGEKIASIDDLRPGDLIFFNTRGFAASHVGIYAGDGMFLHSPHTGAKVRMDRIDNRYWRSHFSGARRVSATFDGNANSFKNNAPQGM